MKPSEKLSTLAEAYWQTVLYETPMTAMELGQEPEDNKVFRESAADHQRRYKTAGGFLAQLEEIPLDGLQGRDRATWQLLYREFSETREMFDLDHHLRPSLFPLGPEFFGTYWANKTSLPNLDAARKYLKRLATFPPYLEDIKERLRLGVKAGHALPELCIGLAARNVRGQIADNVTSSAFFGPLLRSSLKSNPKGAALMEEGRALVRDVVNPALEAYATFIDTDLRQTATAEVSCSADTGGKDYYQLLVRHFTTTPLSPDEIHQLGLDEVSRISAEMEEVATEAGYPGDLVGYRRFLNSDPRFFTSSAEELRQEIESLSKRIDRRLPDFFGYLPRATYGVESIPAAISEQMPPAYAQPNPADNSASGIHWVTGTPSKAPRYMHIPLALHEAWPGHLMHLAIMQELEDLPAFQRYGAMNYSVCLEGWALYCEQLGLDLGFYDTPDKNYGRLDMEIWRALRLVVDTGIHWKGWGREQAIDYMATYLALPRITIEAEVDRYICLPGQALAYKVGHLKFTDLRRRAESALGDSFSPRDFHDQLMKAGPVTMPILDDIIQAWIGTTDQEMK